MSSTCVTKSGIDELQKWMCHLALQLTDYPRVRQADAYRAMLQSSPVPRSWWALAVPQDDEEERLLQSASRAIAHRETLPPMSPKQRARLAMRLRLSSSILRAFAQDHSPTGWIQERIRGMSRYELLEWALIEAWPMAAEVFYETMIWQDQVPIHVEPPTGSR